MQCVPHTARDPSPPRDAPLGCVLPRLLDELLVSLQWGREQTYQPGPPPHSTAELAAANHSLARAVSAHLLGDVAADRPKRVPAAAEFSSSPAEQVAETVAGGEGAGRGGGREPNLG